MDILVLAILFIGKMFDNILNTAKMLFIQRNKAILAGVALTLSNLIYFSITKNIVTSDGWMSIIVVSVASGFGCCIAMLCNNKFSKDRTYVNVIMSDDLAEMKLLRDFLKANKITNVASDSFTKDWSRKTLTITAYAETKEQSKLIDEYLDNSGVKFKRVIQGEIQ